MGGVVGWVGCFFTVVSVTTCAPIGLAANVTGIAIARTANAARSTVDEEAERVARVPLSLRRAVYFTL